MTDPMEVKRLAECHGFKVTMLWRSEDCPDRIFRIVAPNGKSDIFGLNERGWASAIRWIRERVGKRRLRASTQQGMNGRRKTLPL